MLRISRTPNFGALIELLNFKKNQRVISKRLCFDKMDETEREYKLKFRFLRILNGKKKAETDESFVLLKNLEYLQRNYIILM